MTRDPWSSHLPAAGVILLVAFVLAAFLGGCVSSKTTTTGAPFLETTESPETALRTLARRIVRETQTLEQVLAILPAGQNESARQYGKWDGVYAGGHELERFTWRFAVVETFKYGLGVTNGATIATRGYQLVVALQDGYVASAAVEMTDISEREKEWTTANLVSLGTATVGTLLMIRAP